MARLSIRLALSAALSVAALVASPSANAQTFVWDGGGADNDVATAANWNSGVAPSFDNLTVLSFAGSVRPTPTSDVDRTVNQINFTGSSFSLGGNGSWLLAGTNPTISNAATTVNTINNNLVLQAATQFNVAGNSGHLTLGGTISGTGSLNKLGFEYLELGADNTYTGGTTISIGSLDLGVGGTTGSILGNVSVAGGSSYLAINRSNTYQFDGVISGAGNFAQFGSGTTILTANSSFTGYVSVWAGTLQINNAGAIDNAGGVNLWGGNLTFGSGITSQNINTLNSQSPNGSSSNISLTNADGHAVSLLVNETSGGTLSGSISGLGAVTFSSIYNSNQIPTTLTGTNTYSGGTTVNNGTLYLGSNTTTGSIVGNISLNSYGILTFYRSNTYQFDGVISGQGDITNQGNGTTILTADSSFTGHVTVKAGTLQLNNAGAIDNASTVALNGGNLTFGSGVTKQTLPSLSGNSATSNVGLTNIAGQAVALTLTGGGGLSGTISGSGSITLTGYASLSLTGANTYTGGTFLTGTSSLSIGGTAGNILGNISTSSGSTVTFSHSNTYQFDGVISGAGNVYQYGYGTTILTADSSFTGTLQIQTGTLQVNNSGAIDNAGRTNFFGGNLAFGGGVTSQTINNLQGVNASSVINLTNTNGQAVALTVNQNITNAFDGTITGSGSLIKTGTGGLALFDDATYTGGTFVNQGQFQIGGGGTTGSIVGNVWLGNGAMLYLYRSGTYQFDGVISGAGGLTTVTQDPNDSRYTSLYILTADSSFTGPLALLGGTLQVNSSGAIDNASSVTLAGYSYLTFGNGVTSQSISTLGTNPLYPFSFSSNVNLTNTGNAAVALTINQNNDKTFVGTITGAGSLTKSGASTLTLTGANTYAGGTSIQQGTLQIGGTAGDIVGNVSTASGGTLAFGRSNAYTFNGIISGGGNVTQAGTGTTTLTADSSFTGTLTVTAGTLQVSNAGAIDNADSVNLTGGTLAFDPGIATASINNLQGTGGTVNTGNATVTVSQSTDATFKGNITGGGTLVKTGTANLTLTGNLSSAGGVVVNAGTLTQTGGSISALSATGGTVNISGGNDGVLHMNTGGTGAAVDINGGTFAAQADGFSLLDYEGALTLSGGTLAGEIFLASTDTGTTLTLQGNNLTFTRVLSSRTVEGILYTGYFYDVSGTYLDGSPAQDMFEAIQDNQGATYFNALGNVGAPEPGTLALLAVGAVGVISRRRR